MRHVSKWIFFFLLTLVSAVSVVSCKKKVPDVKPFYDAGVQKFYAGDLAGALGEVDKARKLNPEAVEILYLEGWIRLQRGQSESALVLFSRAVKNNDRFYGGHKGLGLIFLQMGQFDDAEKNLLAALERDPKNASIYGNLGDLYLQKGDLDKARTDFEKAAELLPQFADAEVGLLALTARTSDWPSVVQKGQAMLAKGFRQKMLEGRTHWFIAHAYLEQAGAIKDPKEKKILVEKAKDEREKAKEIFKNPSDLADLDQRLTEIEAPKHAAKPRTKKK